MKCLRYTSRLASKIAAAIRKDGFLDEFVAKRYRSWDSGIGAKIEKGQVSLADLEKHALSHPDPVNELESGRQEMLLSLFNSYIR